MSFAAAPADAAGIPLLPISRDTLSSELFRKYYRPNGGRPNLERNHMNTETNIQDLLTRGGHARIDLLRFSVMTRTIEPIVVFLVGEFRLRPSAAGAVAIYDAFFAQHAPARMGLAEVVPVRDTRLDLYIESLRGQLAAFEIQIEAVHADPDDDSRPMPPTAERGVFDSIIAELWSDPNGSLARLSREYDPELSPDENVPGGEISAGQRSFTNDVWRPRVRPMLVNAGFWQLSSID